MKLLFLLILCNCFSVFSAEKPDSSAKKEEITCAATSPLYSDADRNAIVKMANDLKYGHLLFPIGDSIFRGAIKHALLDGAEIMEVGVAANLTTAVVVKEALTSLSQIIPRTCPRKDFLICVETLFEQFDDRYDEEVKVRLDNSYGLSKKIAGQLLYAINHYEQLTPKDIGAMVEIDLAASEKLQKNLNAVTEDVITKWHEDFIKANSPS